MQLIGMPACEDSTPKFTAKHCKKSTTKRIELIEKAHLTGHDNKANYLRQLLTREMNVQHALNQKNQTIIKIIGYNEWS